MVKQSPAVFRILDAYSAPHGGTIARIRLEVGDLTSVRSLKGARMIATSPHGEEWELTVKGFALAGGTPSDERFRRTGRTDLVLDASGAKPLPVLTPEWELSGPHRK